MSVEPVRTFDFGGALMQVFRTLGRNALMLLTLNLTVSLAIGVIEVAALLAAGGVASFRSGAGGGLAVATAVVVWVLCFAFQFAFLQAVVADAGAIDPGEAPVSFGAAFSRGMRVGLSNAGPVGAILLIRGIAVFIASLFLVLPGMFLSVIWTVAVPTQVAEKTGVFRSFARSIELTQGNWLIVFGFNLVAGMIAVSAFYVSLIVVVLIAAGVGIAAGSRPDAGHMDAPAAIAMLSVLGLLYYGLFTLFFAAMAAIPAAAYRELRGLKGGTPASVAAVFT